MLEEVFEDIADSELLRKSLTHPSFTKEKGDLETIFRRFCFETFYFKAFI